AAATATAHVEIAKRIGISPYRSRSCGFASCSGTSCLNRDWLSSCTGSLQRPQQIAVDRLVARDDVAGAVWRVTAVEIGDIASGLTHQHGACRHVPRRNVAFPIAVDASGRDPGKVESRGAKPAQPRDLVLHGGNLPETERDIAPAVVPQTPPDDASEKPPSRRDPQPFFVEESALAALGDEQVIVGRIVDDAGDNRALAFERNRHRKMRDAVEEIGGAVERIDDECMGLVRALAPAAFLAEKAITRPGVRE